MGVLSKEEQLKYYEQALKDYQRNLWKFPSKRDIYVNTGFCKYFNLVTPYYTLKVSDVFNILFSLRNGYSWHENSEYWFRPGRLRPRIKLLKKAIELCRK